MYKAETKRTKCEIYYKRRSPIKDGKEEEYE